MTVVARKDSRGSMRMPSKSLRCMSYEDTLREMEAFLDGKLDNPQNPHEVYVDITETTSSTAIRLPDSEDPDATENSSSFADTTSISENVSGTSDAEVESEFRVDSGLASTFDSYSSVFPMRKKKLAPQWRSFIRPLMWRCKWTELRIKELELQALKYSRELDANELTKTLELHQYTSDFCSRSFPFFNQSDKKKPMKRRKRKLVENVTDISSYMSHHQLFSYLENKKSDPDGTSVADDDVNLNLNPKNEDFGMDDDWLKGGEDSIEQILRQIDTVQFQVQRLRTHLDTVMVKNGVKFPSSENLSLLDAQTSASQSPAFSAGNGDNMSFAGIDIPHDLGDFEIGDLDLPDSLVSDYGNGIPDIIESTVGLLSGADVTIHQPPILESGENILDDRQVRNRGIRDGHMSSGITDQSVDEYHSLENKEQHISSLIASNALVPEAVTVDAMNQDKVRLECCLTSDVPVPKNKRKRGERKAGPGGWNLRSAGEPDSN
ncbi:hypothetical protein SOVF_002590 [Spinacia oleracea]|nr:hypothetical protein SOVF_002590 [Spinacia oleracea]